MLSRLRVDVSATIESLAAGGEGVTHITLKGERRAVFVRGVAPGDEVEIEVDASVRPARGRVLELVQPSAHRVSPACAHAARCGGCDWMHLSLAEQSRAHASIVREALPKTWRAMPIESHAAPQALGYRTRTRLHVRAGAGSASAASGVVVGVHEAQSHDPVEVERCIVVHPALDEARRSLTGWLAGAIRARQAFTDQREAARGPRAHLAGGASTSDVRSPRRRR
jgi:23S rRNA (uracil1939-C5)-methyltransferase